MLLLTFCTKTHRWQSTNRMKEKERIVLGSNKKAVMMTVAQRGASEDQSVGVYLKGIAQSSVLLTASKAGKERAGCPLVKGVLFLPVVLTWCISPLPSLTVKLNCLESEYCVLDRARWTSTWTWVWLTWVPDIVLKKSNNYFVLGPSTTDTLWFFNGTLSDLFMFPVFTFWQFIIELASIIFIVEHFCFENSYQM